MKCYFHGGARLQVANVNVIDSMSEVNSRCGGRFVGIRSSNETDEGRVEHE